MVNIRAGFTNVRKLPGDRDGATHYVTPDDMIYLVERNRGHVCYLHCRLKQSQDCPNRMTMRNGVYVLNESPHNHGPETQELRRIALVNECVAKAAAEPGNLSDIFREIHRTSYADVPASFDDAIQKRMQNARRKNGPSLPKSVLDIEDICTRFDDYGKTHEGKPFFSKIVDKVVIRDKYEADLATQPQPIQEGVAALFTYYWDYWICKVKPETFSVYRNSKRTNNSIECWNRYFNRRVMVAHPNFFNFMKALVKSNADTELHSKSGANIVSTEQSVDLQAVKHAFTLGKSKPVKARLVDRKIDEMWTKYDEGVINISNFLELACNFFEPDRDLPRPTFDTSARPARPDGNVRRGSATAGQARVPRHIQPAEVQPADADVVDYPEPLITLADDGQRHNNFSFHNDVLQSDALQLWEGTLPVTDVNQSIENIQHWNRPLQPAITAMLPDDAVWLNMHPVGTESQSATQLLQRAIMVQPLEPVLAINPAAAGVPTPENSTAFQHDQQNRARGRPKKMQTNSDPVANQAPAPKSRGRPRKTQMTTDIDARGEKRKRNPQAVLATQVLEELSAHLGWLTMRNREHDYDV
ncbi:hypothetical protein DAPPUDRAFT_334208 [Daphnia pulex]|uniref:FLYWCH-type domain-containing protein n=1 Tax=Daphnia pulex TaxID=6669 RepID=E9HV09_DAPPU|nr:hypothetical protein DAPPUDRAFT_334208 [Daphnia pulex]|eukprot:EFX64420.1 hypothetical protein DAPPUDRAFT_334208 [Daphnia pulex]